MVRMERMESLFNRKSLLVVLLLLCALLPVACATGPFRITPVEPSPAPVHQSPLGPMGDYRTQSGLFAMDFPAEWSDAAGDDRRCQDAPKCLISRSSEFMLVRESKMVGRDGNPPSLATELDAVVANFEGTTADAEFLSRTPFVTASGLEGEVLVYQIESGLVTVKELWLAEGDRAVAVAFITWNEGFQAMEPVAGYVFSTVRRTDVAP